VNGDPLVEIGLLWRLGNAMAPDWPIDEGCRIEVRGVPNVRVRYELDRPSDVDDYAPTPPTRPSMPSRRSSPPAPVSSPSTSSR
jgi:hypothetical protein